MNGGSEKEIEISFNLNHVLLKNGLPTRSEIIKKLKKIGAKKMGKYIFRVMKFIPPNGKEDTLRIRDEGFRVSMTYKEKNPLTKFKNEYEIIIDNFDNGVEILHKLGIKTQFLYEKLREIWTYKNCEIVIDDQPALPSILEIELKKGKESNIYKVAKKLGLEYNNTNAQRSQELYKELYDIELKNVNVPFSEMKRIFTNMCKKNKREMLKIIKYQLKEYNKLKKKESK